MDQTLLLEFARRNLDSLQDVLKEEKPVGRYAVQDMIYLATIIADMIQRSWEKLQGLIEEGIEGRKLSHLLKQHEDLIAYWMSPVREFQESMTMREVAYEGVSKLSAAHQRLQQILQESVLLRTRIDTAPPVLRPEAIHEFEQSTPAGSYESGDAILSRLQQGGDL